jgi:hypothetical protein
VPGAAVASGCARQKPAALKRYKATSACVTRSIAGFGKSQRRSHDLPQGFSRKNSIHGTSVGEKDDVGRDIGLGKLKGIRLVRRHPERADAITRDARSAWPVCKAPNSYAPYSDRR